jgi:hypothetical protein
LTISPTDYNATSTTAFVPPPNPPAVPTHAAADTGAQLAKTNRAHAQSRVEFDHYQNTNKALCKLLLEAVPAIYRRQIRHPIVAFGKLTTWEIIEHLLDCFGTMTDAELDANTSRMKTHCHPPTTSETLFPQIEDGMDFAESVFATGRFEIACREWRRSTKTKTNKTRANFMKHFEESDRDMRLVATTASAGYHQGAANSAVQQATNQLAVMQAALAASEQALAEAPSGQAMPSTCVDLRCDINKIMSQGSYR